MDSKLPIESIVAAIAGSKKQAKEDQKAFLAEVLTCSCPKKHQAARKDMQEIHIASDSVNDVLFCVKGNAECSKAVQQIIEGPHDLQRSQNSGASDKDVPHKV